MATRDSASSPDALQQVLDETRRRFVATFVAQCDSIRILVDKVAAFGPRGPVAALTQVTHRLSGLAGTIGFPTTSARACELDDLVDSARSGAFDALLARDVVDAIREAFAKDLASPPPLARRERWRGLAEAQRRRAYQCQSLRFGPIVNRFTT